MRYMTAELLTRLQSADDEMVARADAAWEKACAEYNRHLEDLRAALPASIQQTLGLCLHDARPRLIGSNQRDLTLLLQLDTPRERGLLLTYHLLGPAQLMIHPELATSGPRFHSLLYDEFDLVKLAATEPGAAGAEISAFSHCLLFTGGAELRLVFATLDVATLTKLIAPSEHEPSQEDFDFDAELCEVHP